MNHIITKTQYLSAKQFWSNNPNRSAGDHIIYNAIRGFDLKRGFTEITSPIKLSNGAYDWQGFTAAKADASWTIRKPYSVTGSAAEYEGRMKELSKKYGFEFTPELMEQLREVLK